MTSFNKKQYALMTLTLLVFLVGVNIFAIGSPYEDLFTDVNQPIFEPLLVWSLSLFTCSMVLTFFSQAIFRKWMETILVWFLPIGLLITFVSDPNVSYVLPNRVGFAIFFGEILAAGTLIFALVQKFVYKK